MSGETFHAGRPGSYYGQNAHRGDDNFAIDYNYGIGWDDFGYPLLAVADGDIERVVISRSDVGYGTYVDIRHDDGTRTRHGHLEAVFVVEGERVQQGQVFGLLGNTGDSSGPHLHFVRYGTDNRSVRQDFFEEIAGNDIGNNTDITSLNDLVFHRRRYEPLHGRIVEEDFGLPRFFNGILDVTWYHGYDPATAFDSRYGFSLTCYKVEFEGKAGSPWNGVMVYDALGGAKQAYVVGWNEWELWQRLGANPDYLNDPGLGGPNSWLLISPLTPFFMVVQ